MDTHNTHNSNYIVRVSGLLPYYVPIPEGKIITPSLIGAEPFYLSFENFKPLRHPDDSQGEGIDDGIGTFIRSRVNIDFPTSELPNEEKRNYYEGKALAITNKAIIAVRYLSLNECLIHVSSFDQLSIGILKKDQNGVFIPDGVWQEKISYGPFGIKLQATMSDEGLQKFWLIFNDIQPINSAWLLTSDAKYHNAKDDIQRSILDVGTALEINIEQLILNFSNRGNLLDDVDILEKSIYTQYDAVLSEITGHTLHEKPDLFIELEYIRELRNSVTHDWKPCFKVSKYIKKRSLYLEKHLLRDNHFVSDSIEVAKIIDDTSAIISCTSEWFVQKSQQR